MITVDKRTETNLKSIIKKYSNVDWILLIDSVAKPSASSVIVTEDTKVFVDEENLEKLMALLQSTKPRAIANLVALDVFASGILINPDIKQTKGLATRLLSTSRVFDKAVAALRLPEAFGKKQRTQAKELVSMFIKEMELLLVDVEWMDLETKQKAIRKARLMRSFVGYHDEILNSDEMNKYHNLFMEKMDPNSLQNNQVR